MTDEQKRFLKELQKTNPAQALQRKREFLDTESAKTGQSVAEILKGSESNQYLNELNKTRPDLVLKKKREVVDAATKRTGQSAKQVLQDSPDNQYLNALENISPPDALREKTRIVGEQANREGKTVAQKLTEDAAKSTEPAYPALDLPDGPVVGTAGSAMPPPSPQVSQTAETWGNGLSGNSSVVTKEEEEGPPPVAAAPSAAPMGNLPALPTLNKEGFTDFGGKPLDSKYDRSYANQRSANERAGGLSAIEQAAHANNRRLEDRKAFAKDMAKANFNPATASAEEREKFYERGAAMDLTPQQMIKFSKSYLHIAEPKKGEMMATNRAPAPTKPKAPAPTKPQTTALKFANTYGNQPTQGYRPLTEEDDRRRNSIFNYNYG